MLSHRQKQKDKEGNNLGSPSYPTSFTSKEKEYGNGKQRANGHNGIIHKHESNGVKGKNKSKTPFLAIESTIESDSSERSKLDHTMQQRAQSASSSIFLPDGTPAGKIDRVMLLSLWAKTLVQSGMVEEIICAGMGKPTLATNEIAAKAMVQYWQDIAEKSHDAHLFFKENDRRLEKNRSKVATMGGVIDYGHPQGVLEHRARMARALNKWYCNNVIAREELEENEKEEQKNGFKGIAAQFFKKLGKKLKRNLANVELDESTNQPKTNPSNEIHKPLFSPDDILFTVGGAAAINATFQALEKLSPGGKVITPSPHYSLYAHNDSNVELITIDVMEEPGYRLTKHALKRGVEAAKQKGEKISAFLFCDPNNPLGTIIGKVEWEKIARYLEKYIEENPDTYIILDEAYAAMVFDFVDHDHVSLIEVAPKKLLSKCALFRSGTKDKSAAGERWGVMVTKDKRLMAAVLEQTVEAYGHAPISAQHGFSIATEKFSNDDKHELEDYYKHQVRTATRRLAEMKASMPKADYVVRGAFYILADLSDLKGLPLSKEASAILGKTGDITTDEDIVYSLMTRRKPKKALMIAPLSYYGTDPKRCYVRITCSGGDEEIHKICDILARELVEARQEKKNELKRKLILLSNKIREENDVSADAELVRVLEQADLQCLLSQPGEQDKSVKQHRSHSPNGRSSVKGIKKKLSDENLHSLRAAQLKDEMNLLAGHLKNLEEAHARIQQNKFDLKLNGLNSELTAIYEEKCKIYEGNISHIMQEFKEINNDKAEEWQEYLDKIQEKWFKSGKEEPLKNRVIDLECYLKNLMYELVKEIIEKLKELRPTKAEHWQVMLNDLNEMWIQKEKDQEKLIPMQERVANLELFLKHQLNSYKKYKEELENDTEKEEGKENEDDLIKDEDLYKDGPESIQEEVQKIQIKVTQAEMTVNAVSRLQARFRARKEREKLEKKYDKDCNDLGRDDYGRDG